MRQVTVFIDSSNGNEVFEFPFLYETEIGRSMVHRHSHTDIYDVVDIESDIVSQASLTVTRRVHIFRD